MSKEPVTMEQLEKILKGYEKLGAAEREIRAYDKLAKNWILEWTDKKTIETDRSVGEKINLLNSQFDGRFKDLLTAAYANMQAEVDAKIKMLVEKSAVEVTNTLLNTIKAKSAEIKTYAQETAEIKVAELEKDLKASNAILKGAIRADLENFEATIKEDAMNAVLRATQSLEGSVKTIVSSTLSEEITFLSNIVDNFTLEIQTLLAEKVIDKEAINQKISDIQSELAAKAQSVINFNIEQARQQMEVAAKEEIKGGLAEASANIFGAINTI